MAQSNPLWRHFDHHLIRCATYIFLYTSIQIYTYIYIHVCVKAFKLDWIEPYCLLGDWYRVITSKFFILFFHSKSYFSDSSPANRLWNSLQTVWSSAGREWEHTSSLIFFFLSVVDTSVVDVWVSFTFFFFLSFPLKLLLLLSSVLYPLRKSLRWWSQNQIRIRR